MTDLEPTSDPTPAAAPPQQPAVPAPTVPAGWYPDPSQPGTQRWWTGKDWSDQRAPLAPTPAATTVVVNAKRPVNHVLHLILTIVTLGLWLPVWIIVAIAA